MAPLQGNLSTVVGAAVLRCQRRAASSAPGSPDAEAAEHAITLCLSRRRSADNGDDLAAAAVRNAEWVINRSDRRRKAALEDLAHLGRQGVSVASSGPAATASPEDVVMARALLADLRLEAQRLGLAGPRVLAGLLIGESADETAAAAFVGPATVNRYRRRLRDRAARFQTA